MQYFFILGNNAVLSKAEIRAKLNQLKISFQVNAEENDFLILDIQGKAEPESLIFALAGTIKIGRIIKSTERLSAEALSKQIADANEKIRFGVSPYNLKFDVEKAGRQIKSLLKQSGNKVRFVSSKTSPLSSVIVQKNLLAKNGIELVILRAGEKLFLGKTLAVQPFEFFSKIDYGRPARDDFSGMLPPKLAQIMVNLAEQPLNAVILDPFCGSGTILQQAALLGYKKTIGSDASKTAVANAKINLDWFSKFASKNNLPFNCPKVLLCEVETLPVKIQAGSTDAIVTEPYLGPPLKGREPASFINHIIKQLSAFYRSALKSMSVVLKNKGIIIMIIPTIKIKKRAYEIDARGLMPSELKIIDSWTYFRPDQKIIRRIYKIVKQ